MLSASAAVLPGRAAVFFLRILVLFLFATGVVKGERWYWNTDTYTPTVCSPSTNMYATGACIAQEVAAHFSPSYPGPVGTTPDWKKCAEMFPPNGGATFYITPGNVAPGSSCLSGSEFWNVTICSTVGQSPQAPSYTSCAADPTPSSCTAPNNGGLYVNRCQQSASAAKAIGNAPCPPDCNKAGNPIKHGTGRKYQNENVLQTPTFKLSLTYDSTPPDLYPSLLRPFGIGWAFNYGMRVWIMSTNNAAAFRPDGKFYEFAAPSSGNTYTADADVPDTLTKVVNGSGVITGFQYFVAADDSIENYNANGYLTSIVLRNGQTISFTYSTFSTPASVAPLPDLLITVTDNFGRALQFTYDAGPRIHSVTDPVGNVTNFYYDESTSYVASGQLPGNNLTSIEYPGPHKKLFYYNEQSYTASTNLPNALTGIADENGNRFATYQYDSNGLGFYPVSTDGWVKPLES